MCEDVRSQSRAFISLYSLERFILHCKLRGPSWLNVKLPSKMFTFVASVLDVL